MAESLVLDPAAVATSRTALDITAWIDADGPDYGDAQIEAYMSEASRGNVPVDYRVPNRTITIPLNIRTVGATSFETFRQQLQAKVGLFQREGGWLSRQTSIGTVYADVVNATLRLGGSWLQAVRSIDVDAVLTLECLPDWYQAEVDLGTTTELTAPELRKVMATVKGNYPCRVRIVVTDAQAQSQLGLIWGIRSKNYSAASTAALAYEAEALTPLDTAATAVLAGASGGSVVQHSNLSTAWTPVLSTQILSGSAHLTHVGSYRAWARTYTTSATPPRLRFLWDVGDLVSPVENTAVSIPGANNFYDADLGSIRLDTAPTGTHRWQGMVQAIGTIGGENISIDKLWFVPMDDGYGVLRAPVNTDPGLVVYSARDEFQQAGGALTLKTLPVGGTWTGAGDTDDFVVDTTTATAQRTALSDTNVLYTGRFVTASTPTLTTVAVQANVNTTLFSSALRMGLLARYTSSTNTAVLVLGWDPVTNTDPFLRLLEITAASTSTVIAEVTSGLSFSTNTWYTLRFWANAAGQFAAWLYPRGASAGTPKLVGVAATLATGGGRASGKVGIYDAYSTSTAATRSYDNFAAWVPVGDAVLNANQSIELTTAGAFREDPTGTAYGPVSHVVGSLPRLPPSGLEARSAELLIKGSRGDLDQLPDAGIDDISAQVLYRPSWLHIPEP